MRMTEQEMLRWANDTVGVFEEMGVKSRPKAITQLIEDYKRRGEALNEILNSPDGSSESALHDGMNYECEQCLAKNEIALAALSSIDDKVTESMMERIAEEFEEE